MSKKVKVKLYMVGGFTFQLWDSLEEYNEFKSNMMFWKSPDNPDDGLFTFYNTAETDKWNREEKMVTVDCRQVVAYELVATCDMND